MANTDSSSQNQELQLMREELELASPERHDWSRLLLEILSFFNADSIPESILTENKPLYAQSKADLLFEVVPFHIAVKDLLDAGLLIKIGTAFSMDQLVQQATLDQMTSVRRNRTFQIAVDCLFAVFPKPVEGGLSFMSESEQRCYYYQPHVGSIQRRYLQFKIDVGTTRRHFAELLTNCSWYLYEKCMFAKAVEMASTAKDSLELIEDQDQWLLADAMTAIGNASLVSGAPRAQEAYDTLYHALRNRVKLVYAGVYSFDHPQIANAYMSRAAGALGLARIAEAIKLAENAVRLRQQSPQIQMQMLAMSHINAGIIYLAGGQLDSADTQAGYALDVSEHLEGNAEKVMDVRNALLAGRIDLAKGNLDSASQLLNVAFYFQLEYFGKMHLDTGLVYFNVAKIARLRGDYRTALENCRLALAVLHGMTYVESSEMRVLYMIGVLMEKLGDSEGAREKAYARRSYRRLYGTDLPDDDEAAMWELDAKVHPFYR
ncbi:hypothetical protein B9Z65_378 [Elsinoe australis]|uniref:DUF7779 domain-containing protein n=1 Tax=Elsinoe australis TaxID=40998 RepID=A0A2P7ZQG2_9PEZI|nr:hypothetical protein B9Z65_378 [Elsinoe australis]